MAGGGAIAARLKKPGVRPASLSATGQKARTHWYAGRFGWHDRERATPGHLRVTRGRGAGRESRAMPVYWKIDSEAQLFDVQCEGAVGLADLQRMLDAAAASGALHYRKLFDAQSADLSLSEDEMMTLGVRLRILQDTSLGPLALVLRDEQAVALSRLLGILAVARRPIKVVRDAASARKWLESRPVLQSLSGDTAAVDGTSDVAFQSGRPAT